MESVRIILISSTSSILTEIGNLGEYAMKSLQKDGVTIFTNTKLDNISNNIAVLSNGEKIECSTVIWAGGTITEDVVKDIDVEHHKSVRIIVNRQLKVEKHPEIFALGDCIFYRFKKWKTLSTYSSECYQASKNSGRKFRE